MPPGAVLEDSGRTLVLPEVQLEDAGTYECSAYNEESVMPIRNSFELSVEGKTCLSVSIPFSKYTMQ